MRQKDCLGFLNDSGNARIRSGLRWSFQWKEFVRNHNDVKTCSEVIKTKTALLTSKWVEQGYPVFFRSTRFDNVKVLEESRFAIFLNLLHSGFLYL